MQVYITDLAAYNQGHLIGRWTEFPITDEDFVIVMNEVLTEGAHICGDDEHEEIFVTDSRGFPFEVEEYVDLHTLNYHAQLIDNLTASELQQVEFLLYEGQTFEYAITHYMTVDIYDYSNDTSFADVYELLAYDLVADGGLGDIPSSLEHYIDYSAIGRDLSMDYTEFQHAVLARTS